jgi:hypothetical protein
MVYDTTNNKLYVYNGAWKSVTLAERNGDGRGQ